MSDPLLQELLAATDPSQKAAILAESAIRDLPEGTALIAPRRVLLHWFDAEIVRALSPTEAALTAPQIFEHLTRLPFIERVPWGLAYHELTRQGLLRRYAETQAETLKMGAALAAPVYAARGEYETAAEAFFCYTAAGEADTASEWLEELLVQAGRNQDWQYLASILEIQDEAEALSFVRPLARTPLHWIARGIARAEEGDPAGAIPDYDQAIQLDPEDAIAYNSRGLAYYDLQDYQHAIADYDQAIQLNPEDATAFYNRALAYYNLQDYQRAIADYDQAIQINPEDATAYNNRGLAYYNLQDYQRAIADYDQAIQINPEYAKAFHNRGLARRLQGDYSAAVGDHEQARRLEPENPVGLVGLAGAYIDAGQIDQGRQLAREARDLFPETDYYNRACVEALLGNADPALDLLGKSLEAKPSRTAWAQRDPDLRSLHSHPRFRALFGLPPLE
jgi:tetratricopeptide (TPR) repeat protein